MRLGCCAAWRLVPWLVRAALAVAYACRALRFGLSLCAYMADMVMLMDVLPAGAVVCLCAARVCQTAPESVVRRWGYMECLRQALSLPRATV